MCKLLTTSSHSSVHTADVKPVLNNIYRLFIPTVWAKGLGVIDLR